MRIIGGIARGRRLDCPLGPTRPTSDRVKESLFSIIEARMSFDGINVLDLFAGSGALGFEALSRGSKTAIFVDNSIECVRTIKQNAELLGFDAQVNIMQLDVNLALCKLQNEKKQFGLIFADPPYESDVLGVVKLVEEKKILEAEGLFIFEHSKEIKMPVSIGALEKLFDRTYGDTSLSIFR